ncbi:PIN domain-containing protein [Sinorhizobium meliloti]|uniref:PIN domain-containing protein n=1 Tax=Rhizobium meliloti TaxID=382 RepID=UPI000FDBE0D5|nr:PIN domain-containing protein [Sinorhizobium meliloti]RVK33823.1 PIN domain-containing protein [Sinorhizobium meliloti]
MNSRPLILDTNVLCETQRRNGNDPKVRAIKDWIATQGEANFAIPFAVIAEINRGIHLIAASKPSRAAELSAWLDSILRSSYRFLDMNVEGALIYGAMTARAALLPLMQPDPTSKRRRLGHDLLVAAAAIAHKAPIVTLNRRDFLLINDDFPLPGCYDPVDDFWFVPSTAEIMLPLCECRGEGRKSREQYDEVVSTRLPLIRKPKRMKLRTSSPLYEPQQRELARRMLLQALSIRPQFRTRGSTPNDLISDQVV